MTRPRTAAAPFALAVASCLASATAQAEVRIVVQPDPPRPIAGQPFRVTYALEIINEGGTIRATPLEVGPGLQVMMHGGAPSPPNVMMMGGPGAMMRFDLLNDGFPAITTRKLAFKSAIGELVGFLRASRSAPAY